MLKLTFVVIGQQFVEFQLCRVIGFYSESNICISLGSNAFREINLNEKFCKVELKSMIGDESYRYNTTLCKQYSPQFPDHNDYLNYKKFESFGESYINVNGVYLKHKNHWNDSAAPEDGDPINITPTGYKCIQNICFCRTLPDPDQLEIDCSDGEIIPDSISLPSSKRLGYFKFKLIFSSLKLNPKILSTKRNQLIISYIYTNSSTTHLNNDRIPWRDLQLLDISSNKLDRIDENLVDSILGHETQMSSLSIHGNPFRCDCENWIKYQKIFKIYGTRIQEINQILCDRNIMFVEYLKYCERMATHRLIFLYVDVLIISFILISILVYNLRKYTSIMGFYLYRLRRSNVMESVHSSVRGLEMIPDKRYDAFVAYSFKDEDYVQKNVIDRLENDGRIRLCLAYRDWTIGDYVPDQIAESVENSRATIVVLSQNFLSSSWGLFEFQTAYKQMKSQSSTKLIIIVYGDLEKLLTTSLEPDMKQYLKMNLYVRWDDKLFLEKLKFALKK